MAETHELRLKINAAAARAGAREFVAAINSIKTAIRQLDRDSNGVFTKLKKNLQDAASGGRVKLNIVDRTSLRNLESYSRLADQAVRSTGNTSKSVNNLTQRMASLTASYGTATRAADAYNASVARLNQNLSRQSVVARPVPGPAAAAASTGGDTGAAARTRGSQQAVVDQERVRAAVEATRLAVERLNQNLAKVGGFQTINTLSRQFRDFERSMSSGAMTASDFTRNLSRMRGDLSSASTSLSTVTFKTKDFARAQRESASAANDQARAVLNAGSKMNSAAMEVAGLSNRLKALGDTRGINELNTAFLRFRASAMGTGATVSSVNQAFLLFKNTTTGLAVGLKGAEAAKMSASRAARELASAENTAAIAARRLEQDMRSAAGAANAANKAFRNATGGMRGLENAFSGGFQTASLFRTALGSLTLGSFTQSVFKAGDALDQFNITMEVASGSAEAAAQDLEFINSISARLGTNLNASRDAFSKFAVSSDIAGVSGTQTRQIFESVATAMSVLGRGTEDQKLAFLALEQMMSKGVISAEELRRQLGERLPGAVSLMAKAVGVSVAELQNMLKAGELISSEVLPKFADELDKTFGSQLQRTFNRAGSNLGRLQNEFTKILEVMANSGFLDELSVQFRDLAGLLKTSEVQEAAVAIGRGLADAARMAGEAIQFLVTNIESVGNVVKSILVAVVLGAALRVFGAITAGAQQTLIAANAFRSLGASSAVAAGQLNGYSAAAATTAAQQAKLNAGLLAGAQAGGKAGLVLGGLGRVFGFLGGPIGIAITALSFAPMILDKIGSSAQQTAIDYNDALSGMQVTTFRFFDEVRAKADEGLLGSITAQIADITKAEKLLLSSRTDSDVVTEQKVAFTAVEDTGLSTGVLDQLNEIKTLNEAIMNPPVGTTYKQLEETVDKLKEKMQLFRNAIPEKEARQLEDALLPTAGLTKAIVEQMTRLDNLAQTSRASGEVLQLARNAQVAEAEFKELDGTFTETLNKIEDSLGQLNISTDLADQIAQLFGEMREGLITTDQFRERFATLQPALIKAANETQGFGGEISATVKELLAAIPQVENLSVAVESSDAAASAAASAYNAAAQGIANTGAAASAAIAQLNGYTQALATAQGAAANIGKTADEFIADAKLKVEISGLEGVEKAVQQDLNFGETSRALAEVNGELATLRAQQDIVNKQGIQNFGPGMKDDFDKLIREAEAKRNEVMRVGEEAQRAIFANNESQKKSGGKGGGGKQDPTALEDYVKAQKEYLQNLSEENIAHELLASGMTKSAEAAKIVAEAQANGANLTQQQTMEFLAQAEAAELLNRQLTRLANDPVNDWMNSVPTWREAGQQIETEVLGSLSDSISNFIQTGKFDFEELGASILATISDLIADKAIKEFMTMVGGNTTGTGEGGFGLGGLLSDLFGNGGSAGDEGDPFASGADGVMAGQNIQQAMINGGMQAAQSIQQAMAAASGQVSAGIAGGGAQAGAQVSTAMTTGASTAAPTLSSSLVTGASGAAPILTSAVSTGSMSGAPFLQQGIETGSQTGGGFFQQIFGGMFGGGGGGGGGGGIGGMLMGFLPALFGSGGGVTSGAGPAIPQVMAPAGMFKGAPSFAMGTPNISGGVPAILHNNEAVVPLTGGRKIPIEGGGAGGGSQTVVQNFNISTPDADSFRKSQSQIAADAAASGQRALSRNR